MKKLNVPIEEAQEFNRFFLLDQLNNEGKHSLFWRRIWRIAELMKDKGYSYSITWTNLDMIHHSGTGDSTCVLQDDERIALHSTQTKILSGEIRILEPTHVIYFGWYFNSVKAELSDDVFHHLYPSGKWGDTSAWKEEKMAKYQENGVWHIFTYHPNWGYRQKGDNDGKGYEDRVLEQLSETLTQG